MTFQHHRVYVRSSPSRMNNSYVLCVLQGKQIQPSILALILLLYEMSELLRCCAVKNETLCRSIFG